MQINFLKLNKFFLVLSACAIIISFVSIVKWGLVPGLDFTGGALMEFDFKNVTTSEAITELVIVEKIKTITGSAPVAQSIGDAVYLIKTKAISDEEHNKIIETVGKPQENRYETIGPVIGVELKNNAKKSVFLAILVIFIYIAIAFKKLRIIGRREPFRYSAGAIIALIHDLIIMTGLWSLLGHFSRVELDSTFIVAMLLVLGYSINDTIIVYDRIRENIMKHTKKTLPEVVNFSLNETLTRTINTTLTTLFAIFAMLFFGPSPIFYFVLAMAVGIAVGTYSSIAIASPFLLWFRK